VRHQASGHVSERAISATTLNRCGAVEILEIASLHMPGLQHAIHAPRFRQAHICMGGSIRPGHLFIDTTSSRRCKVLSAKYVRFPSIPHNYSYHGTVLRMSISRRLFCSYRVLHSVRIRLSYILRRLSQALRQRNFSSTL